MASVQSATLSAMYLDLASSPVTWTSTDVGTVTFGTSGIFNSTGTGTITMLNTACGGPFASCTWTTNAINNSTDVDSWMKAYTATSNNVLSTAVATAAMAPATVGHPTKTVAGAVVGSFIGGALLAAAIGAGFLILRRRKNHRQERDKQIEGAFDRKLTGADPSEEIPLSIISEQKPLTSSDFDRDNGLSLLATTSQEIPRHPGTRRKASRGGSIDATSINLAAGSVVNRPSTSDKRQSFPSMLIARKPGRSLSVSAAGLISPVAAASTQSGEPGMVEIVKHLRMQITTLFEQVELHVDNFYQPFRYSQALSIPRAERDNLRKVESPHLEDSVVALLQSADDARGLIKHCIAEIITSRIDFTGRLDPNDALLPPSLIGTYKLMVASTKGAKDPDLDQWRVKTLTLLGIDSIEKSMAGQVRCLAELVTIAFKPWAVARYGMEARSSHLANILREAVELGLEMFGLRGQCDWTWSGNEGVGEIVVFPGFMVKVHDHGREEENVVLEPVIAGV